MRPGDVLGGRFELEGRAGAGGMGEVFRAHDRASGDVVAVKVLPEGGAAGDTRFAREAAMLAELSHPGIVRYVAHGVAASGAPYLVMDWLEGEDLDERLRRQPLTVDESVTLAARVAEALAAVHAHGIVHRDLKPTNLFLVNRDVSRVKLLDFGVARLSAATRMTQTGALVGTPAYMAPEQVRSGQEIDARTDVFALGCVLYECLTGELAFAGAHLLTVLAKVLLEQVPRVRELRPDVPQALDALCARMMAKEPDERPRDGAEVAAALAAMGVPTPPRAAPSLRPAEPPLLSSLTRQERRVLSVVLMSPDPILVGRPARAEEETLVASIPQELCRDVAALGGRLDRLADGSTMVTLLEASVATDQAAKAARCALALRACSRGQPMALATGRAEVTGRLPAGDLLDRAARMLAVPLPPLRDAPASMRAAAVRPAPIAIDEVTAGLLDARFEVIETDAGLWLQGERPLAKGARMLLGKPTACVGRDWEITTLDAMLSECIEDSTARAVLVTAPAGMGKSRLAYELLRRVDQREEPIAIWIGRGDPLRAGAALGMLRQALQGACEIQEGESIEARRAKILARVGGRVGEDDARRVAEFLGELVGAPFPDEDSFPLRAARKDAQLMGDQVRRAWVDFLGSACAAQPVLLVLEDLHWGDLPTVQFIGEALRQLKDRPWMVMALARPEVHELFPALWAGRELQEIRIKELSPKASARLVRQVLGERVSAETLERLVAQADGNAFYLEELIRAMADGSRDTLPETVLAMVQSRLERLDGAARRVLRAASVFGQVFWRGAVEALLGGAEGIPGLDDHLERLERLEWIGARQEARFQGERDLAFRHALVREAAYGMLTDDDRALGHRLAGDWLELASEPSAAVIAEHFDRGREPSRAAVFYRRAAAQALAASDLVAVLAWTERALALGAAGPTRGELLLHRTEAHHWRGELAEAARWARMAVEVLPKGSAAWYAAVRESAIVAARLGQQERLVELADELSGAWSEDEATGPAVIATAGTALYLLLGGLYERAEALHARIDAVADRFREDPTVAGWILGERGHRALYEGRHGAGRALLEEALQCHERAGDLRTACFDRTNLALQECQLGAYAEAVALLRAAIADAERMGLDGTLAMAWSTLGAPLGRLGALDEARAAEAKAIALFEAQGDRRLEGVSRVYLAAALRRAGELDAAEAEVRRAVELLEAAKPLEVLARATLADVLLARDRPAEALAEAREAFALLGSLGKVEEGEALARLTYAEALFATGDLPAARAAITDARDRLLAAAARIDDPRRRESFLQNIHEAARTLELARAWVG